MRQGRQACSELLPAAEKVPLGHVVHDALDIADQRPALHCVHELTPSAAAEPAAQGTAVALPSHACPAGHVLQTLSAVALGARVSCCDISQARTTWHAASLSSLEKFKPATQAVHARSAVADPIAASPWPSPHVRHNVHDELPAAENDPSAHCEHDAAPSIAY